MIQTFELLQVLIYLVRHLTALTGYSARFTSRELTVYLYSMFLPPSAVEHTYVEQQWQVRKITLVNISYTTNSVE